MGLSLATTRATHSSCDFGQVIWPPCASISSVENNPLLHRVTVKLSEVIGVKCLEPVLCNIDKHYYCGCHRYFSISPQCFRKGNPRSEKISLRLLCTTIFSPLSVLASPAYSSLPPPFSPDLPGPAWTGHALSPSLMGTDHPLISTNSFFSLMKCFSSLQSLISNLHHSQISGISLFSESSVHQALSGMHGPRIPSQLWYTSTIYINLLILQYFVNFFLSMDFYSINYCPHQWKTDVPSMIGSQYLRICILKTKQCKLDKRSSNFFNSKPDLKHFRLCGP